MKFPLWVDDPKLTDTERKVARLRYMIESTATKISPQGSIRELAARCDIDRTTIYYAVRKGRITERLATKLQDGAGKDADGNYLLPRDYLLEPMRIACE